MHFYIFKCDHNSYVRYQVITDEVAKSLLRLLNPSIIFKFTP